MLSFPNCKINLGLHIVKKREDGYHDLETVFLPIPFTDVLEIIESTKTELTVSGLPIETENNLCLKAYQILKNDFPQLPAVKIHLYKEIPMGAGLGGGSSDAAFTLQLINKKFQLNLKTEQLLDYALRLGSDCPFFIINKPCFATSTGEILQPINIDLKNYKILIVNLGIHIETKWAFSKIKPAQPTASIQQIVTQPVKTWKDKLINDFEIPVFNEYPQIKKLKTQLYNAGALYASLTGTGSTVYGIFNNNADPDVSPFNNYFLKVIGLNIID